MSISATITLKQLADMGHKDPTALSRCRHQLPPTTPIRDGSNGRPKNGFTVDQIVSFIRARTAFLTEAECRLRLALEDVMVKPLCDTVVTDHEGRVLYIPPHMHLDELTPAQRQQVREQDEQVRDAALAKSRARPRRAETP